MKRTLFMILIAVFSITLTSCPPPPGPTEDPSYLSMVSVPGGSFLRDAANDEKNISTVSAFSMSKYEITVDQFTEITGLANPSSSFLTVVNGPVQYINWYHTLVFCNKLSVRENLTPVYTIDGSLDPDDWGIVPTSSDATWNAVIADWDANGYRLPTEMEFEWAMMGATKDRSYGYTGTGLNTTGFQKTYAGSTEVGTANVNINNYAWISTTTPHTIGDLLPNELGLYDLSGNVYEYCWDWLVTPYPDGTLVDYRGPALATNRIKRGGCWYLDESMCTVNRRHAALPETQATDYGFRVVRN